MVIWKRRCYTFASLCALLFALKTPILAAQSPDAGEDLPVVRAGAMPLYPIIASAARVQGTVKLRVTTDGKAVTTAEILSGPPMLADAAKKTVLTWMFDSHSATSFITTFEYQIVEPARCQYSNSNVTARLPLEVQVTTNGLMTCDPSSTVISPGSAAGNKGPGSSH
jgi:hypothetical protein